jgi:hypothetical protein
LPFPVLLPWRKSLLLLFLLNLFFLLLNLFSSFRRLFPLHSLYHVAVFCFPGHVAYFQLGSPFCFFFRSSRSLLARGYFMLFFYSHYSHSMVHNHSALQSVCTCNTVPYP